MTQIKCDTCRGEGKSHLFTSYTECPKCMGTGMLTKNNSILNWFRNQKREDLILSDVRFQSNGGKCLNTIENEITNLANTHIPEAKLSIYGYWNFSPSNILHLFSLHDENIKIHISGYSNYYNISEFFKALKTEFKNDKNLLLEIGGHSIPKTFKDEGKCKNCNNGIIYGFDSSWACEECDGCGEKINYVDVYSLFVNTYTLYLVASDGRVKYENDEDTREFYSYKRIIQKDGSNIYLRKINAPPFEFDSEFCLRKLANAYLNSRIEISQMEISPYIPLESLSHCPANINVKTRDDDDVFGAFELFKHLKISYKNAISLTLSIA